MKGKSFPELLREETAKSAVWKAAIGNKDDLLALLRSDEPLPSSVRLELALLIEGKLVPAKKGRGRPVDEVSDYVAIARHVSSKLGLAVIDLKCEIEKLRKARNFHGRKREVIEYIAERNDVDPNVLENAYNNNHPLPKMPDYATDEAAEFRRWFAERKQGL